MGLRDRSITQTEATRRANALLEELGLPQRISRRSVGRYHLRMKYAGVKLRQSREIAEAWIDKLGSAPGGKLAHLVIEMLRTLAYDLTLRLHESDLDDKSLPRVLNAAARVALMVQRLEQSSEIVARRERQLKREAAELAAKAARENKAGREVSPERLEEIIREIYGL